VIASDGFSRSLGVQTGVSNISQSGTNAYVTSGSTTGTDTSVTAINAGAAAFPALADRLNVNLPTTNSAGKIALAILGGSDYLVDLELSAMQQEGIGELVSNPRVITSNQKTATIEQGVEIPYQEASASGATSVSFKKAVLSLSVTPQITPDNRVVMDLSVTKDNVSSIVNGGIPAIDTRQIKTQVLVNNGDTVVLGGIYENEKINSVDKVPFLGDIPFIGALFRRTVKTDNKSELLIFVTPKILKEGMSTQLR
jgi:type IV pilus assembly protein PilQ